VDILFFGVGNIHKGRGSNAKHVLMQACKTGVVDKLAEALGGAMVDLFFDAGNADIEDEEPDRIVAVAVDEDKPSVAVEHAIHLTKRLILVGIVMERITAGNHIEAVIVQR